MEPYIFKLIDQCFKQYHFESQASESNKEEYMKLYHQIVEENKKILKQACLIL
ncbi:hypothetical protein J6TS2_19500 [Heyndrickxia sporothermodurans]|nr:hypothetical protein J6TS2_19500 [Heyndrickxia sporothermodurans]